MIDYAKEIDDCCLSVGMLMSNLIRRCRDDEIGYANKIPLNIRHKMGDELCEVGMKFLTRAAAWEKIEGNMSGGARQSLFYEIINLAADTIENLNQYRVVLELNEAPLHIERDKRIR